MLFAVKKIIPGLALLFSLFAPAWAQAAISDTCFNYLNAQDYARAAQEAQKTLQRGDLDRVERLDANLCLGMASYYMGKNSEALAAMQSVENIAETTKELSRAYNMLTLIYTNANDLDRAELYGQRALKAARELKDRSTEATVLSNMGMVASARGDDDRALKLYREATVREPDANKNGSKFNNIAAIFNKRKDYKQAVLYFRKALNLGRARGDTHGVAVTQQNLGDSLRHLHQYVEAEKELQASLKTLHLLEDKSGEATACLELAWLSQDRKDVANARLWFEKAEAIYREIGNTRYADFARNSADKMIDLQAGK